MNFHILTLFPEMVMNGLNTSILGRAMAQKLIQAEAVNIRDYTTNRHGKVDDYIYGGGAGLLMQAQPVYDAWKAVEEKIRQKNAAVSLVGNMVSEGTTPRNLTDLIGSLCDLTSGSGDKGTPIIYIQGYFDNYTNE